MLALVADDEKDNIASKDQKAVLLKKDYVFQSAREWQLKYTLQQKDHDL